MTFIFEKYNLDKFEDGEIVFNFTVKKENENLSFSEKIYFNPNLVKFNQINMDITHKILNSLRLFIGISYWKLYAPQEITIVDNFLSKKQTEFWNLVYTQGMGEFYYKNQIDFRDYVKFPFVEHAPEKSSSATKSNEQKNRSLLMMGGGKDSIVSAELLKEAKKDFIAFTFGTSRIQEDTIEKAGVDHIIINRELDSQIYDLSKRDDTYSGHIPISLGYAIIGILAAEIFDYKYVIASNEKSASFGNLEYLGVEINHQWSKSILMEKALQEYTKEFLTPSIIYFSLLRPLHEIKIVELFSKHEKYFDIFSSCNKNFVQKDCQTTNWCCKCAKCAFSFAMQSAFIPKEKLIQIFGENLFDKEILLSIFKDLLSTEVDSVKPFDCVGTPEETRVAFFIAHKNGEYKNDLSMKVFEKELMPNIHEIKKLEKEVFAISDDHLIPEEFTKPIKLFS